MGDAVISGVFSLHYSGWHGLILLLCNLYLNNHALRLPVGAHFVKHKTAVLLNSTSTDQPETSEVEPP